MDDLDKIQAQWRKQRPDLNTDPMALIGRLLRVSHFMSQEMAKTFALYGLNGASFDVLATLLRAGPPHALSPNELLQTMMITSGTMTNRIDRLEKAGLVERVSSSEDKRSVSITLTRKGKTLTDDMMQAHVDKQRDLVSKLKPAEQKQLNLLLKKYLQAVRQA